MSPENRLAVLSVDQRNRLEGLLMEFEEAWSPGLLEEYVRKQRADADGRLSQVVLSELIIIDLQRGWAVRQGHLLEDYCRRFPS